MNLKLDNLIGKHIMIEDFDLPDDFPMTKYNATISGGYLDKDSGLVFLVVVDSSRELIHIPSGSSRFSITVLHN